jgi:uncharacterized protein (UPF0332 family)
MKAEFLAKAKENLKAAEILFDNQLYDASANRAYYAAFQSAISALLNNGINLDKIKHESIQALFSSELIHKRKIYPGHLKSYLSDLQTVRDIADYEIKTTSKKVASQQLKNAKEFITEVERKIKL